MKLLGIEYFKANESFIDPIKTVLTTLTERDSLFIKCKFDTGLSYYGECVAFNTSWYEEVTINDVFNSCQVIEDVLVDNYVDIHHIDELHDVLQGIDCHYAVSMFDMVYVQALFDQGLYTLGYESNQSLDYDLKQPSNLNYGITIHSISQFRSVLEKIKHNEQYKQVSRIKIKYSDQLEEILNEIQKSFSIYIDSINPIELVVDCNGSLNLDDVSSLNTLKNQYNIRYIEQPFKDFKDERETLLDYPIGYDEALFNMTIEEVIESSKKIKSTDFIVLKIGRLRGFSRAVQCIHRMECNVLFGGMYEYALSKLFTTLCNRIAFETGDVTPHKYYFNNELFNYEVMLQNVYNGKLDGHFKFSDITLQMNQYPFQKLER